MIGLNGVYKMVIFLKNQIEKLFPTLKKEGYKITSPETNFYNCIAWAIEDDAKRWDPTPFSGYYWPADIPTEVTMTTFIMLFNKYGYAKCDTKDHEEGCQKIAIYMDKKGAPQHVARQLDNGKWTSKLGDFEDIEHNNLEGLEGKEYGEARVYLKRKK